MCIWRREIPKEKSKCAKTIYSLAYFLVGNLRVEKIPIAWFFTILAAEMACNKIKCFGTCQFGQNHMFQNFCLNLLKLKQYEMQYFNFSHCACCERACAFITIAWKAKCIFKRKQQQSYWTSVQARAKTKRKEIQRSREK